jgi:hypothetical protein
VQELVDRKLVVVDHPMRISHVLPERIECGLVYSFRLDKMPVVLIEQEQVSRNFNGGKEVAATGPRLPI